MSSSFYKNTDKILSFKRLLLSTLLSFCIIHSTIPSGYVFAVKHSRNSVSDSEASTRSPSTPFSPSDSEEEGEDVQMMGGSSSSFSHQNDVMELAEDDVPEAGVATSSAVEVVEEDSSAHRLSFRGKMKKTLQTATKKTLKTILKAKELGEKVTRSKAFKVCAGTALMVGGICSFVNSAGQLTPDSSLIRTLTDMHYPVTGQFMAGYSLMPWSDISEAITSWSSENTAAATLEAASNISGRAQRSLRFVRKHAAKGALKACKLGEKVYNSKPYRATVATTMQVGAVATVLHEGSQLSVDGSVFRKISKQYWPVVGKASAGNSFYTWQQMYDDVASDSEVNVTTNTASASSSSSSSSSSAGLRASSSADAAELEIVDS